MSVANFKRFTKDCVKKSLSRLGTYDWRHHGSVTVLVYHRVLPPAQLTRPMLQESLAVSTDAFERNMRLLRERYTLLSFKDYLDRLENGAWSPDKRYAIVTLDDGCADNYWHAFPILAKFEIKATIFVCTSHIGADLAYWWQVIGDAALNAYLTPDNRHAFFDVVRAHGLYEDRALLEVFRARRAGDAVLRIDTFIERLKAHPPDAVQRFADHCAAIMRRDAEAGTMTWEQIGEMSAHGIEFGPHAVHHLLLTKLPRNDAAREIVDSQTTLQSRPEVNYVPVFCYPNGDVNDAVRDLVREAGYRAAVTTRPKVTGFHPRDLYRLPRINIASHVAASNLLYKFKLSQASAEQAEGLAIGGPAQA